jgi:hypothetical protein
MNVRAVEMIMNLYLRVLRKAVNTRRLVVSEMR